MATTERRRRTPAGDISAATALVDLSSAGVSPHPSPSRSLQGHQRRQKNKRRQRNIQSGNRRRAGATGDTNFEGGSEDDKSESSWEQENEESEESDDNLDSSKDDDDEESDDNESEGEANSEESEGDESVPETPPARRTRASKVKQSNMKKGQASAKKDKAATNTKKTSATKNKKTQACTTSKKKTSAKAKAPATKKAAAKKSATKKGRQGKRKGSNTSLFSDWNSKKKVQRMEESLASLKPSGEDDDDMRTMRTTLNDNCNKDIVPVNHTPFPKTAFDYFASQCLQGVLARGDPSTEVNKSLQFEKKERFQVNFLPTPFDIHHSDYSALATSGVKGPGMGKTENNDIDDFFSALEDNKVNIWFRCPCRNENGVTCRFPFQIPPKLWKALFFDEEGQNITMTSLPSEQDLWTKDLMSWPRLKNKKVDRDTVEPLKRTFKRHVAAMHKKGTHTEDAYTVTLLRKARLDSGNKYNKDKLEYFRRQCAMVATVKFPLIPKSSLTSAMKNEGHGLIDVKKLKGDTKLWSDFLYNSKLAWEKGLVGKKEEVFLKGVLDRVDINLQTSETTCKVCFKETCCRATSNEDEAVPGATRFSCTKSTCSAVYCRACIRQVNLKYGWMSRLEERKRRDEFETQMKCPCCKDVMDLFLEYQYPPLLGNEDLRMLVEYLRETHENMKNQKATIIKFREDYIHLHQELKEELRKARPSGAIKKRIEDTLLRLSYQIDSGTPDVVAMGTCAIERAREGFPSIVDNFEGKTSREEQEMIKSVFKLTSDIRVFIINWTRNDAHWVPPDQVRREYNLDNGRQMVIEIRE